MGLRVGVRLGSGRVRYLSLHVYLSLAIIKFTVFTCVHVEIASLRLHVGALNDHDEEPVSLLALNRHGAAGLLHTDGGPA